MHPLQHHPQRLHRPRLCPHPRPAQVLPLQVIRQRRQAGQTGEPTQRQPTVAQGLGAAPHTHLRAREDQPGPRAPTGSRVGRGDSFAAGAVEGREGGAELAQEQAVGSLVTEVRVGDGRSGRCRGVGVRVGVGVGLGVGLGVGVGEGVEGG